LGSKQESWRIILTSNIKYRAVLYFTRNNLFFSVLQLTVCHGLLIVEASLSLRHSIICRITFDEGSARHIIL